MDKEGSIRTHVEYLQHVTYVRGVAVVLAAKARAGRRMSGSKKPGHAADAELKVRTIDGRVHELWVEQRLGTFSREQLNHVAAQFAGRERGSVLFAGYVPTELAAEMTKREINFVDRSGNCYLRLGDGYVAQIQGRTAVRGDGEKSLRSASVRVLLALATAPTLLAGATREIAAQAGGVSPQTVADVIELLRRRNIVTGQRERTWLANSAKPLLDLLVQVWPACANSLTVQRYRTRSQRADEIEAALTPQLAALGEWRWSGGLAVGKLTKAFSSNDVWIYLEQRPALLPRFDGMLPDPQGNVRLLYSPGNAAFAGVEANANVENAVELTRVPEYAAQHTVHPILVYLDALVSNDARTNEAAQELLRMIEPAA